MVTHKVSWDRGASYDDVVEAVRRVFAGDGIPRHAYEDGRIMKYDWSLATGNELLDSATCISYEEHIQQLMEQQDGEQG